VVLNYLKRDFPSDIYSRIWKVTVTIIIAGIENRDSSVEGPEHDKRNR